MASCKTCRYMNKDYDDFQREFDDTVIEGKTRENHFCPMYEDRIPPEIYYDGEDCEFYDKKEE